MISQKSIWLLPVVITMHFIILIIGCKTYNIRAKTAHKKFPRKGGGSKLFKKGGIPRRGGSSNKGGIHLISPLCIDMFVKFALMFLYYVLCSTREATFQRERFYRLVSIRRCSEMVSIRSAAETLRADLTLCSAWPYTWFDLIHKILYREGWHYDIPHTLERLGNLEN